MSKKVNVDDDTRYNIHENECYATTTFPSVVNREEIKEVFSKKKWFCTIMIAVAIIAFIIALVICFVFAFIEISSLKSTSTAQFSLLNDQYETIQQNLMLNTSFDLSNQKLLYSDSALENRTQQLIKISLSGLHPSYPAASCAAIQQFIPSSPSGHYWIRSSNGSAVHVYCDMTKTCGNITGGWMRVAELDMRDSSSQCPSALRNGTDCPIPSCIMNIDSPNCSSVIFPSHGFNYSKVCGIIRAYQKGIPDSIFNDGGIRGSPTIDSNYVDGISLTYGESPRQHIWTFGVGLRGTYL